MEQCLNTINLFSFCNFEETVQFFNRTTYSFRLLIPFFLDYPELIEETLPLLKNLLKT